MHNGLANNSVVNLEVHMSASVVHVANGIEQVATDTGSLRHSVEGVDSSEELLAKTHYGEFQ